MAHSYFHAKSSVRSWGGLVEDYLPLHNWFDATKAIRADFRHRALRHHNQGIKLAELIFGPSSIKIGGDPGTALFTHAEIPVKEIGLQHMNEDFKDCPDYSKWYELIELQPWMKKKLSKENACISLVSKFGGNVTDYEFLYDLMTKFDNDDPRSCYMLWHSWGIFDVEAMVGITFERQSDNKIVPTRTVAETLVLNRFGMIPKPGEWLDSITEQKWMYINAKQLSKEDF